MRKKSDNTMSRRSFLTGTAAVAATGAAAGALACESEKKTANKTPFDYDVIVVGGGFAGVTAAREHGKDGYRTLLLEARSRLGGRTFTSVYAGQEVEYGGAWIHWLQPHVWAETQRYGLGVVEDPLTDLDQTLVMFNDGSVKSVKPAEFDRAFRDAFEKFCHDARTLFPRPYEPLLNDKVLALDKLSALDRINELDITDIQRAMLNSFMALYGGGKTSEYGLPGPLKLYACGGWDYDAFMDTETHYRIETGTLGLINAMIEDSGADVKMNSPVMRIEQFKGGVKVITEEDEVYTAAAAVITVPLNTYKNIEFSPPLSKEKQVFVEEGQLCQGCKLYVHVKQNLGRIFAFADEEQPLNWVQTHDYSDELGTILSITIARRSTLDLNDEEAIAAEVRKMFPGVDVLSSASYDWQNDPFSLGGWPAYRVGQLSRLGDLQKPEGRLLFAGAATSNGWHENIDGAVETGLRAGREVRELIG